MDSSNLEARDIDGVIRTIPMNNLTDARLFGMDFATIRTLRHYYLKAGGRYDITVDSVKELYKDRGKYYMGKEIE